MTSRALGALGLALAVAITAGCGAEEAAGRGTLAKLPVQLGPLGYHPGATLAVAPPTDRRPEVEHLGETVRTSFFFTVAVATHWERRGNYVTDDFAASPDALREMTAAAIEALRAANVAREVVPASPAKTDFVLETEIEHLYGTHYAVNEGTVIALFLEGGRGRGGMSNVDVITKQRQYASYGNVVLHARLVDRRGPQPVTVWDEHVLGTGQQPPQKDHKKASQTALRMAVADAMATLAVRTGAALDRLQTGPQGPAYVVTGQLPPVFLIERVSRMRDFLERVYVETATGRVLRHDIVPNADHAYSRPGEWLLSRRTPEGVVLSPDGYEAYARALAGRYDLRTVDDAYRYHFFGVKGVAPAPAKLSAATLPAGLARPDGDVAVRLDGPALEVAGDADHVEPVVVQ